MAGERTRDFTAVSKEANPRPASQYVGVYYSPELDVEWAVALRDSKLAIVRARFGREELVPLLPDIFQLNGGFFTLEFQPPVNGLSPSFEVTTERVRHLKFVRVPPREVEANGR